MIDESTPIGGTDFITAPVPNGFGMRFYAQPDGSMAGRISLDQNKQGPPGHAHGGALIAILDEAMGAAAWYLGHRVVAVNLQFDLKRAVPLHAAVIVRGRVDNRSGRKLYASSDILLPGGTIAVSGTGLFLEAPNYVGPDEVFENPFVPMSPDDDGSLST
ncbi:MAG: PaaI family thioesterase [Chloroflexota bacterium]